MTFVKGKSGNPSGFSKEMRKVIDAAQAHCPRAIEVLREIMDTSGDDKARAAAADKILDRGLGKPAQSITGAEGGPIKIESTVKIYLPDNGR